jgi:hypothetical protein
MKFDEKILTTIKLFGQQGQTIDKLCSELGISCYELSEFRKVNTHLDEALKIYEYNFNKISLVELYADAKTAKQFTVAKDLLIQIQSENNPSDNEIIVKRV